MELRTVEQKVVVCVWVCVRVCVCSSVWTAGFPWPDSVRLVTSLPRHTTPHHHIQTRPPAFRSPSLRTADGKCREKRSDVEEKRWEERGDEDEEEEEGGRAGQGLSVEKTAMKGNCHAPVLAQKHLSREEHAKCAGHVLTIPPLYYTHTHT